jgi:hypothetical protein
VWSGFGRTRRKSPVADLVYVVLTMTLFAVLALAVRAVERI